MPTPDPRPDTALNELVADARTDREAFGRLYEAYYERILGYCHRRLNDRAAAEDACGNVFLKIARKMPSFAGDTETDFRRWAYRIATNEVNAILRRVGRRRELWDAAVEQNRLSVDQDDTGVSPEPDEWPRVHRALLELTSKEQSIVALRLWDQLSYDEIAGVLGVRAGAVRVAYSRAISKLRDRLSSETIPVGDAKRRE